MNKPLKHLLLRYELAFLLLLLVTGALGSMWAFFWQQTSSESVRLGHLHDAAQDVRTDLFRQIKEVTWARLKEDPEAIQLYAQYARKIDGYFKLIHRNANSEPENQAVENLRQSYRIIEKDMNKIFTDPYMISRAVRLRVLNPAFERNMVGHFEQSFSDLDDLISVQKMALEEKVKYWTGLAPLLIPIPFLLAGVLFFLSRASIRQQVVRPVEVVKEGAAVISKGKFNYTIPQQGVSEMVDLAGTINDMASELARNRDALIESEKQAALGALVPVVAHNIRNPLASIRASAQLLDHVESEEDKHEIKEAVLETVDRLGRWVSALVSYLHPMKPHMQKISLTSLIETILKLLQLRLDEKEITLSQPKWDKQVCVHVDPDLMEQALYGLLSNAVDASPTHGIISISIFQEKGKGTLIIDDQGNGMPFDPEPGDLAPGPTTKRFGTGLGIPVAYKVCNTHGWQLSYEKSTTSSNGTRVRITMTDQISTDLKTETHV